MKINPYESPKELRVRASSSQPDPALRRELWGSVLTCYAIVPLIAVPSVAYYCTVNNRELAFDIMTKDMIDGALLLLACSGYAAAAVATFVGTNQSRCAGGVLALAYTAILLFVL